MGGLNIINPKEALYALMAKWIIMALSPGESNLHILLKFWLRKIKPDRRGQWPPSLQWSLTQKFSTPIGYRVWNWLIKGWKAFSPQLRYLPPKSGYEVLNIPYGRPVNTMPGILGSLS